MSIAGLTYQCELCGGVFDRLWSTAEANAEAFETFGTLNASEDESMAVICDECHCEFMKWFREQSQPLR